MTSLQLRALVLVLCLAAMNSGCSILGMYPGPKKPQRTVAKLLGYPDDPYLAPMPDAPKPYKDAHEKLEKNEYEAAIEGFRTFLRDEPSTNWTLAAQFNWGHALELLGRYPEAVKKYEEVAEKGKHAPKIQGLALLRLAIVLEALGEDDRSLAALKDAERRSKSMAPEVAQAELPARLAAAYAREKNFVEAERYFKMADQSLSRLRAQVAKDEVPEWLPRILYSMGHRPPAAVPWDRFEESILPIERSQIYLLQSAEMGFEPWASKSSNELIDAYKALRASIDTVPTPAASEIIVAARQQQRMRWDRLVRLGDAIAKLRSLFVIEIKNASPEDSPVRKIMDFADELEENVQSALMLDRPVGETGTPESLSRKEKKAMEAKPSFPGEGK